QVQRRRSPRARGGWRSGRDDGSEHRFSRQPAHKKPQGCGRVPRTAALEEISERVCQTGQSFRAPRRGGIYKRPAGDANVGDAGLDVRAGSAAGHRLPARASRRVLRDVRKNSDRRARPATRGRILDTGESEPGEKGTLKNSNHQTPNTKECPNTRLPVLEGKHSLGFGPWDFFGVWSLGIGISSKTL